MSSVAQLRCWILSWFHVRYYGKSDTEHHQCLIESIRLWLLISTDWLNSLFSHYIVNASGTARWKNQYVLWLWKGSVPWHVLFCWIFRLDNSREVCLHLSLRRWMFTPQGSAFPFSFFRVTRRHHSSIQMSLPAFSGNVDFRVVCTFKRLLTIPVDAFQCL